MAWEDCFLRLDPNNYDTEIQSLLATSSLTFDDCISLYENGNMSKEDFEFAKGWFEFFEN